MPLMTLPGTSAPPRFRLIVNFRLDTYVALQHAATELGGEVRALDTFRDVTAIQQYRPTGLLAWIFGYPHDVDRTIDLFKSLSIPVAVWHGDDPHFFRDPELHDITVQIARKVDVFFTHTRQLFSEYGRLGVRCLYLPTAARYSPGIERFFEGPAADGEFEFDYTFIGTIYDGRQTFLDALAARLPSTYRRFLGSRVSLADAYEVYRRSRVTLAFGACADREGERTWGVTERTWDVPLVGALLLQDERSELAEHFEIGREAITFTGVEDCAVKVVHYCTDSKARESVARQAQARVLGSHRMKHRLERILAELTRVGDSRQTRGRCPTGLREPSRAPRLGEFEALAQVRRRAIGPTDINEHLETIFTEGLAARPRLIVELGVRGGESTFALERVARLTGAKLVSVDVEDCAHVSTWEDWRFVREDDISFGKRFPEWCRTHGVEPSIDLLFIDTSHTLDQTRAELATWMPHVATRGRVFLHDTNLKLWVHRRDGSPLHGRYERGVTQALEECLGFQFEEMRDFAVLTSEWFVKHDSYCNGLTMLERRPLDVHPSGARDPAGSGPGSELRRTIVLHADLAGVPSPLATLKRAYGSLAPGGRLHFIATLNRLPHRFTSRTVAALVAEGFMIEELRTPVEGMIEVIAARREEPSLAWTPIASGAVPRLSIFLETWDSLEPTVDLLAAIRAFTEPPYDLVIIDNASTDGIREFARVFSGEPGVRVIENSENRRSSAAFNQALATCNTEYVVALCCRHSLVTVPGWEKQLIRFMDENPGLPIAGDVWNPYGMLIRGRRYRPGWTPEGHGRENLLHVQGGAWIVRKSTFERVGPIAEDDCPHAGADVEFSYRLLSYGLPLGRCPAIAAPSFPEIPEERPGVVAYHPASEGMRKRVMARVAPPRPEARIEARPPIIVYCEHLDNECITTSIIRELRTWYDVRVCGPRWPVRHLHEANLSGARFYLELDSVSASFERPANLSALPIPKFAWVVDTHKKPAFHAQVSREIDLTFFANRQWSHVLEGTTAWLPLHCDTELFHPVEAKREFDIVFVGSQSERADPIRRIAAKHALKVHVAFTGGPREKTETAAIYAKAKLVFNRHVTNDLNFRVFEAMASGRVLLTDAQGNGQYELFEDGKHYVLYKDEHDLEAQILKYLGDDAARARIEREAAAVVRGKHSTRARVRQLRDAIEEFLAARAASQHRQAHAPEPRLPASSAASPKRWLFFVGEEPATIEGLSYGEQLARVLAARGDSVVVARQRRRRLPLPARHRGEPEIVEFEFEPGPLPSAPTTMNEHLAAAGPLHMRLARELRQREPFDAIVGEGAFGALVAQPLAEQQKRPFTLLLPTCEVERRGNKLTREELYWAELEHWGVDRADEVLVPSNAVRDTVMTHYRAARVRVETWAPSPRTPARAERIVNVLGLGGAPFVLVLAHDVEAEAKRRFLEETRDLPLGVALAANDLWVRPIGGAPMRISSRPLRGGPLAALVKTARVVATLDRDDPRALEAAVLAAPVVAVGRRAEREFVLPDRDELAAVLGRASRLSGCAMGVGEPPAPAELVGPAGARRSPSWT